jgi:hypothetical protein
MFWRVVLLEFGPLFLLFPYFLKPRGDSFRQILMLSVCVSLGVVFLVGYSLDKLNMLRFFQVAMLIVHLFAASFLVRVVSRWVTRPAVRGMALAGLVSAMILTPISFWTGSLWLYCSLHSKALHPVDSETKTVVSDLKRRVPPLARILAASDFIYPLHSNGYFALHDSPRLKFYLSRDEKENFDASLKFRPREAFLAWRPEYLLVPEDVLRHFQAVLPEASISVLQRYAYSREAPKPNVLSDELYLVEVQNP